MIFTYLKKRRKIYSSKEYKLLKENNVDTAQLLNLEPDVNAGVTI